MFWHASDDDAKKYYNYNKKSNANKQAKQQKTKQKNAERENVFYSIVANNKRRRILDCYFFLFLFQFSCLIS